MFLCSTYIVLKASSCMTFRVIFATRASIVCIDSGICDMIHVSLAPAIQFFDILINCYTPNIHCHVELLGQHEFTNWLLGGCFTRILRVLQNNLMKIFNSRNHIYGENFKLKLSTCVQSMALGIRTKFQLEILIRNMISAIHKFRENILESSQNVSETHPWDQKCDCNLELVIFKLISRILSIFGEIATWWMAQDLTDDLSILV